MTSSIVCTAHKLSKPFLVFTTRTVPQWLCHHHGKGQIYHGRCHLRHSQMIFKTRTYSRYAALSSSYLQSIQLCNYSTTSFKQDKHKSTSRITKYPKRSHDGEKLGVEKQDVGDDKEDAVGDGREINSEDKRKPQIGHQFLKAREKMQETRERMQEKFDQVKEMKENIFTIPNFLTTSRILLSPVLGYLVICEYYTLAASLFLLTSATDVLDGWIARNFENQQSVLGSIIDPLADKVLITVLTLSLTISGLIPGLLTFIIIGRDVMLITGVAWLRYKSLPEPKTLAKYFDITHTTVKLQPTTISKYNTLIQVALVGFTIGAPVFNYVDHPFLQAFWYVTATSTVLSGLSYVFLNDTFKYLKRTKSKN